MKGADYTHKIKSFNGHNVMVIEDLDLGNKSVTNDIVNVVRDIGIMEHINPRDHIIVYKDSSGLFDAYDCVSDQFHALNETTWHDAVRKYLQMLERSRIGNMHLN